MKHQIATIPEQSQRLIACGVNPESADMCYNGYFDSLPLEINRNNATKDSKYIPAWSLSALLALLPSVIKEDNDSFDEIHSYGLLMYPYMQGWQIDYQCCVDDECFCLKCIHDTELIEVCVTAIEWLTANGYKLNEI